MDDAAVIALVSSELMYGCLISLINIAVQALITVGLIRGMRKLARRVKVRWRVTALIVVMVLTAAMLTVAHVLQVAIWSTAYDLVGAVAREGDSYYLAFVNFTTLGYGDIVPVPRWRLLGPLTAANGMLLFGWSTALMFAVLSRSVRMLHLD